MLQPPIEQSPDPLHYLITKILESQHFFTNVKKYNGCFFGFFKWQPMKLRRYMKKIVCQLLMFKAKFTKEKEVCYIHHNKTTHFSKYICWKYEKESESWSNIFPVVKPWLAFQLQKVLNDHNPYICNFKTMMENGKNFKLWFMQTKTISWT